MLIYKLARKNTGNRRKVALNNKVVRDIERPPGTVIKQDSALGDIARSGTRGVLCPHS